MPPGTFSLWGNGYVQRSSSASEQITQGIILLCFFLPLAFFPGLISLYRLPKTAFLAFFTSVLCWLCLTNHLRLQDRQSFTLPLLIPITLHLLIGALSLLGSINPYEGSNFLFLFILGIALFWVTANAIEPQGLTRLFHWSVIAAAIVSILGIAQVWGADILTLIPTGGPGATFGNKNMAAQYLLFVLPAAFYLLLCSSESSREWLYAVLAGLIGTYFVYTRTRAAWGGAMFAAVTLSGYLLWTGFDPRRLFDLPKHKWAFLGGITGFVIIMNTVPPQILPNFGGLPVLPRVESMLEVETEGQDRFAIWANSLAIFADRPILGAGKGNFRFIYPVYARRVVEDPAFTPQSRAADAHNDYVQLLAETGLLGAASFLLILALLALRFWRGLKQRFDPKLLVFAFALVAILAEAFWDFPFNLPVPVAFFWIYSGILWKLTQTDPPDEPHKTVKVLSYTTIALVTILSTLFSVLTLSSLRGEFYYSRGARETYQGRADEAERNLTKAAQISPLNYRYHFLLGLLQIRKGDYEKAAESTLHSLTLNPYNINALNNLGVAYASAGNIPKAIQAFQTSLRIWPRHIEAHRNLATIYAREGEKKKAIQHFQAALALDPADVQARESLLALGVTPLRRE